MHPRNPASYVISFLKIKSVNNKDELQLYAEIAYAFKSHLISGGLTKQILQGFV